jgi:hypothetical protein
MRNAVLVGALLVLGSHLGHADREALLVRQAEHLAVIAAAEAEVEARKAEAQAKIDAAVKAAEDAVKAREKKASDQVNFNLRLSKSKKDALKHGEFSVKTSSPVYHETNYFQIKPKVADKFCLTVPRADTHAGLRNGERLFGIVM